MTDAQDAAGKQQLEAIRDLGIPREPPRGESNVHVLSIVGQIEGHQLLPSKNKTTKYEHVIPQLVAVEQDPKIDGLLVILNTVGGDIEAGLAIAEMVNSLSKPVVSLVLGGGHSIGAPIAVAADYSFIAPTATITIHPIRLTGLVIGVPQTYEYLDKMQARVIQFLVNHSRITEDKLREAMFRTGELVRDVGTVLIGNDAVQLGLIAELGGLSQALDHLRLLIAAKQSDRDRNGEDETEGDGVSAPAYANGRLSPSEWSAPADPSFGGPLHEGKDPSAIL